MAFWKKSDDPWDMKPEKKQSDTTWWEQETAPAAKEEKAEEGESLSGMIKGLFQKKEEAPITPQNCPWCGKEMEWGCITGGRDIIYWQNWKPKGLLNLNLSDEGEQYDLMDEGGILRNIYKTAWRCRDCGKLVADFAPTRTAAETEELYRKPTGYEEQINAWGANPDAYKDYQAQWNEKKEETT